MTATRVLVVDDSVVIRRLVTSALSDDPGIEIVGVASNGRLGLQRIEQLAPDLVTLDVEMPEMDGLETLIAIRARWPRLPVVMFSTLTERGTAVTIEALQRGASDYVTKPANVGSVTVARERIREELIPRIHALCPQRGPLRGPSSASRPPVLAAPAAGGRRPELVVIGASTGGPNALTEVFATLPALDVPIAIVQHMPPVFTRLLADRLAATCGRPVTEAVDGLPLRAGTITVAPGGQHLTVTGVAGAATARLSGAPPECSCRPSVDVLFRTAVAVYGGAVLGVVLTGMGEDGGRGAAAIRDAGGEVVTQDEATSVVWGMPGAVVRAGAAAAVVPLQDVAASIAARVEPAGRPVGAR